MSQPIEQSQREDLRHAALRWLAEHPAEIYGPEALASFLRAKQYVAGKFTLDDLLETLAFLEGLGLVARERDQFGATSRFRVTSDGVLTHERSQHA